jgi:hypothetical protein
LGGKPKTEAILQPFSVGRLHRAPRPIEMQPDSGPAWQFPPENGDTSHYPGLTFAQFLAYYNDRAGVYIACEDTSGAVKLIKPVHRGKGIRLGFAHAGDWRATAAGNSNTTWLCGRFRATGTMRRIFTETGV